MADIELVIKIPNSLYANLKKIENHSAASRRILDCVKNGTPLPKGHGELKDVSNLLTVTDYDGKNEKTYVLYDEIKHAPIIIEADKGGE